MITLNEPEKKYFLFTFILSASISLLLIIYKVNFKKASIISILFAFIFLTSYIYQPFLLALDMAIGLHFSAKDHQRDLQLDNILLYEYKIVGGISTIFSTIVFPIYEDYFLSGYFTFAQKLCDAIKRRLKKVGILGIIFGIYVFFTLILFIIKGLQGYKFAKDFLKFILDCLIIPNFCNTLWYLGSFYPSLAAEFQLTIMAEKFTQNFSGIVIYYLNKDKEKVIEAYNNLNYLLKKDLLKNMKIKRKEYIKSLIEIVEKEENNFEINLYNKKENKLEIEINMENLPHILASSIRNIKKIIYQIPRKIYILKYATKKFRNKFVNLIYAFFLLGLYLLGIVPLVYELFSFVFLFGESVPLIKYDKDYTFYYYYFYILFLSSIYFANAYYCILNKNSITQNIIYGTFSSDTLSLLEFSSRLSSLITPLSFISTDYVWIPLYDKYRNNIIFTRNFNIPIVDNLFIDLKFIKVAGIYGIICSTIVLSSLTLSFLFHSVTIRGCGKCKKLKMKFKINDKIDNICCCKNNFKYYSSEEFLNRIN